ncbi:MAG: exopolysaccharide Pel transporter PelG [Roseburia sp.]|nr:exopolysaccharide Pel transporter PelG [Roseburia sp.]
MAGIGVTLNKIYGKNTVTTNLLGFGYSAAVTVAPMFLVIGEIFLSGYCLGFSSVGFSVRELFACTVLYIFIFALLTAAPFNAVLSKYMSDVIYEDRYEDILPCFYVGMLLNLILSSLLGIPFCIWEYFVGQVELYYVCTGFCGYISLVLVFYSMLYLSICKDYKKISFFFLLGMLTSFLLSLFLVWAAGWEITYAMLFSLVVGFLLIACLELAATKQYFRENSRCYRRVLYYFRKYWKLVLTNFLYTLGLYIHNFVFWNTDIRMVVADSFVCAQPYDMASCIAMFTNISATILFISRVEMNFHERYKAYSEAVIGGRGIDIANTKGRMFRQLATELMNLVRIQFIVSVVIYLLCIVFLPRFGFSDLVMQIYPSLAAGYFILFIMYSAIIFLYYFNDLTGSLLTAGSFCITTFVVSISASALTPIWYGLGVIAGAGMGWSVAYSRLRWVEKHMDVHVFCRGSILKRGKGRKPTGKVYTPERNKNKK